MSFQEQKQNKKKNVKIHDLTNDDFTYIQYIRGLYKAPN